MPIIQFFESKITFRDTTTILQNTDKHQYLSPTRMFSYITMKVPLNIIYSLGTAVFSTNKTDRHDVTEILLKMALNTISHQYHIIWYMQNMYDNQFHCNIIFQICQPESDCFPDGLPEVPHCFMGWRIWISTRWGHKSFIIFIHSSNTYLIWKMPFCFRENTNTIRADSLSFSTSATTKNITSLTISFTYLLKKCERDCQVNTIILFSFHLIFWHCSNHCTLGF